MEGNRLGELESVIMEILLSQMENEYKDFMCFIEEVGISLLPTGFESQYWVDNKPITKDELDCKYKLWKENKIN